MAKRTDNLAKKVEPSWLVKAAEKDTSLLGMDEYRILPQFKLIQPTTDQAVKKEYGEGSVLVMPGNALAWKDGDEPFDFVPQFFFVSFEKWSDLKDTELPMVVEKTFDPTSEIATKSRSKEDRFETYPDNKDRKFRYVERLMFPGVIHGSHTLAGTSVVLAFQCGEFFQGKNFISAIRLRRSIVEGTKINIPLWAQVWSFWPSFRDRGDRKWFGFDFKPAENPLIGEDEMEEMKADHEELKELHTANRLAVDGDEKDPVEKTRSDF